MKRNLNDYREEMKVLEARHYALDKKTSSEANRISSRKKERPAGSPSAKWARLMPLLMAVFMAIITLFFLIISEVLKNH